ncbi:hypothetical protein lerEdw1_003637 [Lerista edwardsae]|nr:hypothetical protein lerEdw1_003637 [Lerista edwardsae]
MDGRKQLAVCRTIPEAKQAEILSILCELKNLAGSTAGTDVRTAFSSFILYFLWRICKPKATSDSSTLPWLSGDIYRAVIQLSSQGSDGVGSQVMLFVKKDMSMKPQERKEKWERHPGKKPRESENCLSAEPSENGHNNDAGSSGRETDRGKERVKKKIPLKPHKRVGRCLIFQPDCG